MTATPAASVAVTKPPKMPPRMTTGSAKVGSAATKVVRRRPQLERRLAGRS